jgi:2-dehydropantoate 2-reductase
MRILVFGAGALGGFLGGLLSQKYEVTLYGREEKILSIQKSGLKMTGISEYIAHPKILFKPEDLGETEFSLIILAVKSYDTNSALNIIKKNASQTSTILSLQNGLDNEIKIAEAVGENRTLGGVTSHGITYVGPGHVHHAGIGETIIGEMNGQETDRIKEIASALSSVGIETKVSRNIGSEIWAKGIVNAAINPLTALTRLTNGYLLRIPILTKLLEDTCLECIRVAEAAKIDLLGCDVINKTKNVARLTGENRSSMLQDIDRGKKTEIDSINGAIVEVGREHGVDTPINSSLVALVKGIEKAKVD